MFDRLKSLPLTIFLTILIWMYAESQVTSSHENVQVIVPDVPVSISGPPSVLARYEVELSKPVVTIAVSGTGEVIEALRLRVASGDIAGSGVSAYLHITADDEPSDSDIHRRLRYVLPEGVMPSGNAIEMSFRLIERRPAASGPASK